MWSSVAGAAAAARAIPACKFAAVCAATSGGSGTVQAYVPDPPDNLVATPMVGGIQFNWDMPLEMLAEMPGLWQSGYEMIYGVSADRGAERGAKRGGTDLFYRVMNSGSAV